MEKPKITFKSFHLGITSEEDIDTIDAQLMAIKDCANVDINDPIGAITRSPGYYPSITLPETPPGYVLTFFTHWSVDNPTQQELYLLYFKHSTNGDFKIYLNPGGTFIELTEVETVTVTTVNNDFLVLDLAAEKGVDGYYTNWIIENITKSQFAFIRNHDADFKVYTVEKLLSNGYGWQNTDTYKLHRSQFTAFLNSSLLDISAFDFIDLTGRLRIGTGIGANAVAQWLGYNKNQFVIFNGAEDRSIRFEQFILEPLNKLIQNSYSISFNDDSGFAAIQIIVTAEDLDGQEAVVAKLIANDSPRILDENENFTFDLLFSCSKFSKKIKRFNVYANDNASESVYFKQDTISVISQANIISPSLDVIVDGWTNIPLFEKVDEIVRDDNDYIQRTIGSATSTCELKFQPIPPPISITGFVYKFTAARVGDFGGDSLRVSLYNGANLIHTGQLITTLSGIGFNVYTETLTPEEIALITDYSDLRVKITYTGNIGGTTCKVSWVQIQIEASGSSETGNLTLNSQNLIKSTFNLQYTETGRIFYYNPNLSVEAKFRSSRFLNGRVFLLTSDNDDYVRHTNFNTNGAEQHIYFPFDETSGYGFFTVNSGDAQKNTALAVTKDRNLLIFKERSCYIYSIANARGFTKTLELLFSGFGAISQNAVEDNADGLIYFADNRTINVYSSGISEPQSILNGKMQKLYDGLKGSYKKKIKLKYNRQRSELWIYIQVSGEDDSIIASDYRFWVFSTVFNNMRILHPKHYISFIDKNGFSDALEFLSNGKIQKWDYNVNKVFTHDGEIPPMPFLETHKVSINSDAVQSLNEMYCHYACANDFTIKTIINDEVQPVNGNSKILISSLKKDFRPLRLSSNATKFSQRVEFHVGSGKQLIREFGVTYIPAGQVHERRKQ